MTPARRLPPPTPPRRAPPPAAGRGSEGSLFDERARPHEERPQRARQPLGEVDHRAVDPGEQLPYIDVLRGGSVEDPGAVEVHGQTVLARDRFDGALMVEVHHGPGAMVMRVLEPHEPSARVVDVGSPDR